MKNNRSYILALIAGSCLTFCLAFTFALYTHPFSVRVRIAKALPSIEYEYIAKAPDYKNELCDLQNRQLEAAKSAGLRTVPSAREDITSMMDELVKVRNCRAYSLASMKSSVPYLRPNTEAALREIGTAFRDSLRVKGLPDYRILVTSLLRTGDDVGDLRKTNALAVNNSCHCYGTTFDISYTLFEPLSLGKTMAAEDLKKVLGEVLIDQKRAGNIFVKHEVNQPCFHITSRH